MTSSYGRGLPHLAAAVDQRSASGAAGHVELIRLAERGGLDFVTLDDQRGTVDAPGVLAYAAPVTSRIGLVARAAGPAAAAALGALDWISGGRAGARTEGPGTAGDVVRVADAAAVRAGQWADVVLVSVGSPEQAAGARAEVRREAAAAGRDPDGVRVLAALLVDLGDGERAAERGHGGGGPRFTPAGPLYRGGPVDLAELIAAWHSAGTVDGFHLTPVEPRRDLERLVNGTVGLLQHRGLFRTFYPGSTLREHLGVAPRRPYAVTEGAA
ncbi:LLM class flavin-dependent oxidoreductase [Streptomyces sp. NPDC059477]|uniref:LLM class flavin-dependent oxidoreductase n=1 Tax=Streptomyces sp. NPDC059477 TaxID=3346847 RepID=UPI0036BD4916